MRDALVTTYMTSPRLEAGRSELRAVDELVPQALAGYRPSLFLNSDATAVQSTVRQGEVFSQNRSGKSVGVTLRQNLYAGGGTQASVSQAEHRQHQSSSHHTLPVARPTLRDGLARVKSARPPTWARGSDRSGRAALAVILNPAHSGSR